MFSVLQDSCAAGKQDVCGVDGQTYSSMCALKYAHMLLDYKGPCKTVGKYGSKLLTDYIVLLVRWYLKNFILWFPNDVEYCLKVICKCPSGKSNPRHVFNLINLTVCILVRYLDDDSTVRCAQIKCPTLTPPNCDGVTPPGACCKVCGKQLRSYYTLKLHLNEDYMTAGTLVGTKRGSLGCGIMISR